MDREKIDEIGEKLGVNSLDIERRNSQNWIKNYSFWTINGISFVLSSLMGLIVGLSRKQRGTVGYPYSNYDPFKNFIITGVHTINIFTGILTVLPKRKYSNFSRIVRIGIAFLNLIFSLTISLVIYNFLISLIPPLSIDEAILYSVYKSPAKGNIQNQGEFSKNLIINLRDSYKLVKKR